MNTIGIISRIEKGKGQDVLIEAVYILKKRIKNIRALIYGKGEDLDLKRKVRNLNLENQVKFLGFQEDINRAYGDLDVFVFPTYWPLEGFGIVLLEAMKAGIPIVTTNFGPVPEIVGDSAIMVPPKDAKHLAEAIYKVLKNNKLAKQLVIRGKKRVVEFDIKKIGMVYMDVFLETIKSNA